jgi:hypothetical protein
MEECEVPPVESVEDLLRSFQEQQAVGGDSNDEEDDAVEDDPYQVRVEEYRRVSHEEFTHSTVEPIDRSFNFHFSEFVRTAQHVFGGEMPSNQSPQEYYTHDPMVLVRAAGVACNMKLWARATAAHVPYSEIQTLENYDTTKVLSYLKNKPSAKQKVEQMTGEFLYAAMTVDAVTRELPDSIASFLADIDDDRDDGHTTDNKATEKCGRKK